MITKIFKNAAVKFKLSPQHKPFIVEGMSHVACHEKIKAKYAANTIKFPDHFEVEEGYIFLNGEFIDRQEAMRLAKSIGIIKDCYMDEDLFFEYKVDWSKACEK